jgi:tetratricopeptide (TPR) repeat protein
MRSGVETLRCIFSNQGSATKKMRENFDPSAIAASGPDASRSATGGNHSATDVPSAEEASELLRHGVRAEEIGALDRAVDSFSEAGRTHDAAIAAEALTRLADVRRSRAEWEEALRAAREAQRLARAVREEQLLAHAVVAEGNVFMCRGDFAEAIALFERVLEISADPKMRGLALQNIGSCLAQQGQIGAAERAFSESYGNFQRAGYRRGEATALNNLGRAALDRGDVTLAEGVLAQAVEMAREVGHGELIALAMVNLAEAKARRGDLAQAHELASVALGHFTAAENQWRAIECLRLIGTIDEEGGHLEAAAACYERGLKLAREIGAAVETRTLTECVERLRRAK